MPFRIGEKEIFPGGQTLPAAMLCRIGCDLQQIDPAFGEGFQRLIQGSGSVGRPENKGGLIAVRTLSLPHAHDQETRCIGRMIFDVVRKNIQSINVCRHPAAHGGAIRVSPHHGCRSGGAFHFDQFRPGQMVP